MKEAFGAAPSLPWVSAALNPRSPLVPSRLPGVDGAGDFVDAEAERGREAQDGGSGRRASTLRGCRIGAGVPGSR